MPTKIIPALKTAAALSGGAFMMGGANAVANAEFLKLVGIENNTVLRITELSAFIACFYVMTFSRGIALWNAFNKQQNSTASAPTETPLENSSLKKIGKAIGIFGFVSTTALFFISNYASSKKLLSLCSIYNAAATISLWLYTFISSIIVYYNFSLPRAINNGKDVYKLLFIRNNESNSNGDCKALLSTLALTSLGSVSFSAIAYLMIEQSLTAFPYTKNMNSTLSLTLTYLITFSAALMFALGNSLETYQHLSQSRHFQHNDTAIASYPRKGQCLLYSHKCIGTLYLVFILTGFYGANIALLQSFGAKINFDWEHTHYLALAGLFTLSYFNIERIFSYKNMMKLSEGLFKTELLTPLIQAEDNSKSPEALQV